MPKKPKQTVVYTLRIPEAEMARIETLTDKTGIMKADIVRMLLQVGLLVTEKRVKRTVDAMPLLSELESLFGDKTNE